MHIALLTSEFPPYVGGISSHVAELARALAGQGHEVEVVAPHDATPGAPVGPWAGATVHRPRLIRTQPFYDWLLNRWLARLLRARPFDVLHVHGFRPLVATRGLGAPTVFTNHTSGFLKRLDASSRRRRATEAKMRHVAHLIAPSEELVDAARALGYGGPTSFVPNGVDVARFGPGPSDRRAAWGIGPETVVVLLARRLVEKNGVVYFGEAAAALRDLDCRLVLAGDGADRPKVEAAIAAAGMADRALFLGAVPNDAMPDVYRAADISVLPSLMEATSITGLESMATGLPLVGTMVGGIPALIDDGRTGLLVPPRDPAALGTAIRRLALDADLRRRMGDAARRRAETEFAWGRIAERTADLYRSVRGNGA